jgi:peptidoglycan/xylan/chitin deacetylase (PgdA/CDA1 family)
MRHLSLTFDDGPDRHWTPRVLGALQQARLHATFFMVGERVLAAPAIARAVIEAGHEVQLHCHRHLRHTELSEGEIEQDTDAALVVLGRIGVRPTHWRTPWGVSTEATLRVASARGLKLVRWSIDTHDWRGDSAVTMLARARPMLADGGAVLMHDALGPGALRKGCGNTVELLGGLVAAARQQGLGVGPLSQGATGPHGVDVREQVTLGRLDREGHVAMTAQVCPAPACERHGQPLTTGAENRQQPTGQ